MTIKGSVVRPTEKMSERETMEAFIEGAKKSASAARELAKETQDPHWLNVAGTLESMSDGGQKLANMKSMNRLETLMAASIKANPKGFLN